jgi:predicted ATPase with chaperone activity
LFNGFASKPAERIEEAGAYGAVFGAAETNGEMSIRELRRVRRQDASGRALLGCSARKLGLSGRAFDRILKVAVTPEVCYLVSVSAVGAIPHLRAAAPSR